MKGRQMYRTYKLGEKAFANTHFRYLRTAEDVEMFVKSDKRCFCYGAGKVGKRFAKYCRIHDLELGGFIVSDNKKKENYMLGLPIYYLSELLSKTDIRIVVAVSEALHVEVANELLAYRDCNFSVKYICHVPGFMVEDFEGEVAERSKMNLLSDYKKIAAEFSYQVVLREHSSNASYGHAQMMKRLLGMPMDTAFPDVVLHGLGWAGHVSINEIDYSNIFGKKVYVSGKEWRDYLAKILPHKTIIDIGNYIRYESSLYSSEELDKYKKKLGRTLLVFPYHSIQNSKQNVKVDFQVEELICEIEKRKKNFDSVLVCMYYYDIQIHNERPFKNMGYGIVSAGHMADYNFTRRLRSIIELSDVTMSNNIGSHLPYCVCLNKPHYLFRQDINFRCEDDYWKGEDKELDINSYSKDYNGRYFFNLPINEPSETSKMYKALEECFSKWSEKLTDEQIELVTYIYGDMSPISENESLDWCVES